MPGGVTEGKPTGRGVQEGHCGPERFRKLYQTTWSLDEWSGIRNILHKTGQSLRENTGRVRKDLMVGLPFGCGGHGEQRFAPSTIDTS